MIRSYVKLLRDERWIAVSRRIRRERPVCQGCEDAPSLTVHHGCYCHGLKPWEYPDDTLWALCDDCHEKMDDFRKRAVTMLGAVHPQDADLAMKTLERLRRMAAEKNPPPIIGRRGAEEKGEESEVTLEAPEATIRLLRLDRSRLRLRP